LNKEQKIRGQPTQWPKQTRVESTLVNRKSDILIRRIEDTKGAIRIINVHDPYDPCGYDNKRVRVKVRVRVMVKARVKVSARVRVRLKARNNDVRKRLLRE
jgi:hypothetical protein